jgi:sulfide:quinone oxidoreductase
VTTKHKVVVLGSSFAGLTVALDLANRAGAELEIVVVAKSDRFVFLPSLVWVPFGLRAPEDISFDLGPVLASRGIALRHETVAAIDLARRVVVCAHGHEEPYDTLVVATGAEPAWDEIPGLGPHGGHTSSVFSMEDALATGEVFRRLLASPGPVVIGSAPHASAHGAAYEVALNLAHQLRRRGVVAPILHLSAEPFLGHLGLGGIGDHGARAGRALRALLDEARIDFEPNVAIARAEPDALFTTDGRRFPFVLAMIAPPVRGARPVRALADAPGGAARIDARGFLRVGATYQLPDHPEVFAAGAAVALPPLPPTPVPCGVARSGYASEEMARVVAHNVVARLRGEAPLSLPPEEIDTKWILDAGRTGVMLAADRTAEPRTSEWVVPGPEAHWAKVALEKLFLATHRRGRLM